MGAIQLSQHCPTGLAVACSCGGEHGGGLPAERWQARPKDQIHVGGLDSRYVAISLFRNQQAAGHQDGQLFDALLAQNLLHISNRKDVQKPRDVRPNGQLSALVLVKLRNVIHGFMKFLCQGRDDPLPVRLLLFRNGH